MKMISLSLLPLVAILLSCTSNPTRETYCQSLSSEKSFAQINAFEDPDQALKRQKSYCEPDYAVTDEAFRKTYAKQREEFLKKECSCEVVVFKQYEKGYGMGVDGKQTQEEWAKVCASVGQQAGFEKGVRSGDALKAQMLTEPSITQRIGYSSTQIKERCTYTK